MCDSELFKMRKIIRLTLIKIGIRCDLVGFAYLCAAIEYAILDSSMLSNLCGGLYVVVGKNFNVNKVNSVERSMRHAIDNAFEYTRFVEINKIYNTPIYNDVEKPTVGKFISIMVEYYNMGLYENYITI